MDPKRGHVRTANTGNTADGGEGSDIIELDGGPQNYDIKIQRNGTVEITDLAGKGEPNTFKNYEKIQFSSGVSINIADAIIKATAKEAAALLQSATPEPRTPREEQEPVSISRMESKEVSSNDSPDPGLSNRVKGFARIAAIWRGAGL